MSIFYCEHCDNFIDLDYNVEHEEECNGLKTEFSENSSSDIHNDPENSEAYGLDTARYILGYRHESYLRFLIKEGKIKATKVGNSLKITSEELDRFIRERHDNSYC